MGSPSKWSREADGGESFVQGDWALDVWPVKFGWKYAVTDPAENTDVGPTVTSAWSAKSQAVKALKKRRA
jgi:hypothetical protein